MLFYGKIYPLPPLSLLLLIFLKGERFELLLVEDLKSISPLIIAVSPVDSRIRLEWRYLFKGGGILTYGIEEYLHYLHQSQIRAQKQNEAGGGIGQ